MATFNTYEFLNFIVPGLLVIGVAFFDPDTDLGDSGSLLIALFALSAAFLLGQLLSMLGSFLEPFLLLGTSPTRKGIENRREKGLSRWPEGSAPPRWAAKQLPSDMQDDTFDDRVDKCYVLLQHLRQDGLVKILHQQVTFHRNMSVACSVAAFAAMARSCIEGEPRILFVALGLIALTFCFVWRHRRFARSFARSAIEGVALLPAALKYAALSAGGTSS